MRPIDSATLSHRVRDHLREDILANRLPPGTHLQEKEIAGAHGISRAPVREALRLLAVEDLVAIEPRRGAVVKALSPSEFLAAYQVREALEMLAIRLAVPRMTDEDLKALRDLHAQMATYTEKHDADRFFRSNNAFHSLFAERSGNDLLQGLYRQLINKMRRYRMRSLYLRGGLDRSIAEHAAILEAVESRDAEEATRLLSEHIQVPQRILRSVPEDELVQVAAGREPRRRS